MARVDGLAKANGTLAYAADIRLPGLLTAAVVRSPFPHARIVSVDTSAALAIPGVRAVVTAADPGAATRFGRRVRDIPILAVGETRYVGEAVAAVAAENRESAERAAAAIRVEYEELPAVFDPAAAMQPGAPLVHAEPWKFPGAVVREGDGLNLQSRALWREGGDVEAELAAAPHRVDLTCDTPFVHQGYIEPQACVAEAGPGSRIRIWAAHKAPFKLREHLSEGLDLPAELIEVQPVPIGGDFGGKGSPMDVPLCILLSRRAGRPVSLVRRYAEDLMAANPRHASRIRVRAACSAEGCITALDVHCIFNGGAYAGFKPNPVVNLQGARSAGSPYRVPAIRIESMVVYTHTVPGGHRRAPGAPQVTFAVESALDELARRANVEPFEFRRRNLLQAGDTSALGEHWDEIRGLQTFDAAMAAYRPIPVPAGRLHGRGIGICNRGTPVNRSGMALRTEANGGVTALVPIPENGAGGQTVVRELVARALQVPPTKVCVQQLPASQLPPDEGVGGSRVTATMSFTVRRAVEAYRAAAPPVGESITVAYEPPGRPQVTSFAVQIAQVAVDPETGQVEVLEILTAHDVANIVNLLSHQAQIEGGVAMGFSYACLEDLHVVDGRVTAANLSDFKLASHRDVPPVTVVLVRGGEGVGPDNVKAIAEMGNVAVPAAIANAVRDAVGVRPRSLPISAEAVYWALHPERK